MTRLVAVIDGREVRMDVRDWNIQGTGILEVTDANGVEHRFGPGTAWQLRNV